MAGGKKHRNSTGFTGVRERPNGLFYAEIRAAGVRQPLGNFLTADEAARAYDAVACVLGRPRSALNDPHVRSVEEAVFLAEPGPDRVVSHRQSMRRIRIAQEDERAMADFSRRNPQHVILEKQFYKQKRAECKAAQAERRARHREIRARRQFCIDQLRLDRPTISWDNPRMTDFRLPEPSETSESTGNDSDSGDDSESSFEFGDYP